MLFILNAYAAPADNTKEEPTSESKIEEKPNSSKILKEHANAPTTRQKRLFNPYGFGFPPISPIIYQNRRSSFGYNGYAEDPYQQIYRRLQDLSRQPVAAAPIQFPFFFPVIFIPQAGCGCSNNNRPNQNNTAPGFDTRFPVIDDSRQNWGFVVDNNLDGPSTGNDDYDEDISRPISFSPVRPNRPLNIARPPVEHGSSQAGSVPQQPLQASSPIPPEGQRTRPSPPSRRPTRPQNRPPITTTTVAPSTVPSACDGAVLTCCHQPQITFDCFVSQGCPDPNSYGVPCDSNVILRIIEKFQRFYGERT